MARSLTDNLVRSDERRRIARELHDTTSQLLVALQLQLGHLRHSRLPEVEPLLEEMEQVLHGIHESIRQVCRESGDYVEIERTRTRIAGLFYSLDLPHRPAR
jgi:signal transduction histidine kinase